MKGFLRKYINYYTTPLVVKAVPTRLFQERIMDEQELVTGDRYGG